MMTPAWYVNTREAFLADPLQAVVGELANNATREGLYIESDQHAEWCASVGLLQRQLGGQAEKIKLLRHALTDPDLIAFRTIVLEYDFRRRGLRVDCVLLGDGIVAVLEFKRTRITAADREQCANYAVNFVEFHEETQRLIAENQFIVAPILVTTAAGTAIGDQFGTRFHNSPWDAVLENPLECDANGLRGALIHSLKQRRKTSRVDGDKWLRSRFSPSSSILDAAISLYGQHDVSAINAHAAEKKVIEKCSCEVADVASRSLREGVHRVIFVSGAPGAGKTLVGLKLVFHPLLRSESVFVTGNTPLVEVLSAALTDAYKRGRKRARTSVVASGYAMKDVARVISMSTFKIVKAHNFLGHRGDYLSDKDGRVVIFDEAQRTYRAGRRVLGKTLKHDEALLILQSLQNSHPNGAVVVALVGHNQAINSGEMGVAAWFKAAAACGWRVSICDETLALPEVERSGTWGAHPLRDTLRTGHLPHSMRFYRNGDIEKWADYLLANRTNEARSLAEKLSARNDTIWITRSLNDARRWIRERRIAEQKAGIIASGQARRLSAEGLFVDFKPDIAKWMLAPSGDVRSANMLETVQNQYQIQGLELDYTIVCWDGDLRRVNSDWSSYKMIGADWKKFDDLETARNGYRVLLTRARKGMIVFVPSGDRHEVDMTRDPKMYDAIAEYLIECGGTPL